MLKIGIAELRIIQAIGQMEPCTVSLINIAGCRINASSKQLLSCISKGLVRKYKAAPVPKLSDDEKIEIELSGRDPFGRGRRPWMFELTAAGRKIAAGIELISEALEDERRSTTSQTVRGRGRVNGVEKVIRA